MRRIAIITLYGNTNYGNRLQNLAVQKIFEKRGFVADTIDFFLIKSKIKSILRQRFEYFSGAVSGKRKKKLQAFNKKYISVRHIYAPGWKLPENIKKEYDYFAVGSDQVWNPNIRRKQREILFLKFADKKQRIAIAPSIGVDRIDDGDISEYKDNLNGFYYLSCREDAGAKEISRITDRECIHLIDPTLEITAEEWRRIAENRPFDHSERYAFLYFLGDINQEIRQAIKKYCSEKNLSIKMIVNTESNIAPLSPLEFINVIDNAEMVFTDSFHGAAFSVNMGTPFFAFDRVDSSENNNQISSRIVSLVSLLGLQDRYNPVEFDKACDFDYAKKRLAIERARFDKFVDMAIDTTGMEE